ncbi:beta-lactamase-like protein [Paraphoma chrysanthemicola]|uniref:Protein artemis n=1 Tax=Paraphoma chrysanthemicola TaxID=798071 RepID=A0A8K0VXL3_9PLEO|nr:beta-lactamase-like protein [Paraphoma chrysanthemicola]
MSTFKGIIAEFPQIRVDYFRQQQDHKPPLACFLSHVHSDHLTGLESIRAPFVYCSAATKEILLRLEKYHYRINFAKGILESRNVTYDRSMRKLAKSLPLDTPTMIELSPGNSIRVTLIDANHCVGAVMFLIEGDDKAILYTGDIRAEMWWVNSLVQNPLMLPYTFGNSRLDCIYLDTTFATKSQPYRNFPSKSDGLHELLDEVRGYPDDTIFYFHAWTFGYENVWIALSAFLKSRIHLDDYRARIYGSLSTLDKKQLREVGLNVQSDNKSLREFGLEIREAPALCGFRNGNHIQPGCLTSRESVRIHSCERGMGCRVMDRDANATIVHIIPIITRSNGIEIAELGAGGGKGDLDQKEELETGDIAELGKLMELCAKTIKDETLLSQVLALLQQTLADGGGRLDLDMKLQKVDENSQDALSIQSLVSALSSNASKDPTTIETPRNKTIRFPYSRHSSYSELCELVAAFKPKDVFPCTVDEESWTPEMSMQSLFGEFCSANIFRHDIEMMALYEARLQREEQLKRSRQETQEDTQITEEEIVSPFATKRPRPDEDEFATPQEFLDGTKDKPIDVDEASIPPTIPSHIPHLPLSSEEPETQIRRSPFPPPRSVDAHPSPLISTSPLPRPISPSRPTIDLTKSASPPPTLPPRSATRPRRPRMTNTRLAYEAAIGTHLTWADYGGLTSTRRREDREEEEL